MFEVIRRTVLWNMAKDKRRGQAVEGMPDFMKLIGET